MRNKLLLIIVALVTFSMIAPLTLAQTDSLAVWENIADGTLTSTWVEVVGGEWQPQNDSGVWEYNCTTSDFAWTFNETTNGNRWMNTWEVTANDAEAGVASIMVHNLTTFYGVVYYLDFNGTGPEAYIIYYDGTDFYYWNDADTFDTNISNATDLSHDCEWDYLNGWCRVKAEWNFNDYTFVSIRFKIWEPSADEPIDWMVDERVSPCDYSGTEYKSGLFADGRYDLDPTEVDFRRIFFWNMSYDLYAPQLPYIVNQIACPTVSANTLFNLYNNYTDVDDVYNQSQLLKDYINLWDLDSIYSEAFWDNASNQNDTVYVFSLMVTECRAFFEDFFGPGIPDDFPDNMLWIRTFLPIDGTSNDSDCMLLRIDADFDDTYDATDYAVWSNDTDVIVYHGWTEWATAWFGDMFSGPVMTGEFGEVFRDEMYYQWDVNINWDMVYNGAVRVGSDPVRMSIYWHDEDTDNLVLLQDFDDTNDTDPYPNSDDYIFGNDPVFLTHNDSSAWLVFYVDESISGEPLADPEDPVVVPGGSHTLRNTPGINIGLVILLSLVLIIWALNLIWTIFSSTKKITADDIKNQLIIVVVLVIVLGIILSVI